MLVDFYYLTATPLDRVLPRICERIVAEGGKLLIVAEPDLIESLDALLWTYAVDSFLPHGRSDGVAPEVQPILLSPDPAPLNGAEAVALADGRWRDEALSFARTFYFFDAAHLGEARATWRALKGREGVACRYWKQVDGRWVQGP
ncbi:DNA polymerase III subunit chi [Allosphingosinicella humi]